MSIVSKFNNLKGKYSRGELRKLCNEAKKEGVQEIVTRLSSLLRKYPKDTWFTINRANPKVTTTEKSILYGIEELPNYVDDDGLGKVSPNEIYDLVTDSIIKIIKSEKKLAWRKPIKSKDTYGIVASNFESKKPYKGINSFLLNFIWPVLNQKKWEIPFFLTFKQIQKRKGKIKKGAHGYKVIYYTVYYQVILTNKRKFKTTDIKAFIDFIIKNKSKIPSLKSTNVKEINQFVYDNSFSVIRYYNVFNADDITGIDWKLEPIEKVKEKEKIEIAENIVKSMPKAPKIINKGNEAFYYPPNDTVNIPGINNFKTEQMYYGTLFHELIHSTGHKNRLNRSMIGRFGSKEYAKEELIAELGASFLNAEAGILYHNINNSAAYLKSWMKRLVDAMTEDNRFFFQASAKAQQAADFILDRDKKGAPKYLRIKPVVKKTTVRKKVNKPVTKKASPVKKQPKVEQLALFGLDKTAKNQETINFNKQIIKAKRDGTQKTIVFDLGVTKGILKKHIGNHKILMSPSILNKIMSKDSDHSLIWSHLINLPDKLNSPIAIFKSKSKGYVILTELINHLKKPIIAVIHVNDTFKIAKIASLYSKRQKTIYSKWEKEGLLIYKNKKRLETLLSAPIAVSQTFKSQDKDTKKNNSTKNKNEKNLGSINIDNELFQVASEKNNIKDTPNTFELDNEMGKLLGKLQRYRLAIVLTGDPHAGKSEFVKQLIDSFINKNMTVGFFDLEQGGLISKDTRESIDRNISFSNQKKLAVAGEAPDGIDTIKKFANKFDVVAIDSFQKLQIPNTRFDELRIEYPNTIWLVIFQQNGEGGTRGGVTADYDAPVKVKVHKVDHTFINNYAEVEKNRGNQIGLKYNIASKKMKIEND